MLSNTVPENRNGSCSTMAISRPSEACVTSRTSTPPTRTLPSHTS